MRKYFLLYEEIPNIVGFRVILVPTVQQLYDSYHYYGALLSLKKSTSGLYINPESRLYNNAPKLECTTSVLVQSSLAGVKIKYIQHSALTQPYMSLLDPDIFILLLNKGAQCTHRVFRMKEAHIAFPSCLYLRPQAKFFSVSSVPSGGLLVH